MRQLNNRMTKRRFVLTINTENEAFEPDARLEIARILDQLASDLDCGKARLDWTHKSIQDINGNTVGHYVHGEVSNLNYKVKPE